MPDFIDFIDDANGDPTLVDGFLKKRTADQLEKFFKEKGYKDVSLDECERLSNIKKKLPPYEDYPSY